MEETRNTASLTSQSAWLVSARVIGFVFALILPLIIVRLLSQEAVGIYRQSFQVAGDAAAVLTFGFNLSAFYYFSRDRERRSFAVFNILLFNFAMGAIAFLFLFIFPGTLRDLFQTDLLLPLAPKIGLLIWFWLFSSFIEFAAVANQESRTGSLFIIGTQLTKTILISVAVLVFHSVEAIINAALIQCLLQSILLLGYLNSRFPKFWKSFDLGFFKEQAAYAIPFGLAGLLWTAQASIHFYFVGHRFSEAEYAIYAYGCFQLPLVAVLAESAAAVLLPRMSELQLRGDYAAMTQLITRAAQKLAFYYFAIYAYLIVVSGLFITTLFTENYSSSTPIFVIYLTLIPASILLVDPIFRSFEGLGRTLIVMRLVLVCVLTVALYGIKGLSLQGIVAIVVAVSILDRIVGIFLAGRKLGLSFRDLKMLAGVLKTAVAALLAAGISQVAFSLFKRYIPNAVESLSLDLNSYGPRMHEFIVGSAILGCTLMVFVPVYLLIANALNLIDEKEKKVILKSWRFVTG